MLISEALEALENGHSVYHQEIAEDICEAFGLRLDPVLVQHFVNEPNSPKGYHGEDGDGVYSLRLSQYVARQLGVYDQARQVLGRGTQAREYAKVVRAYLLHSESNGKSI